MAQRVFSPALGMQLDMVPEPKQFTYEDLELLTDNFSVKSFIGRTSFCRVYRGKIPRGWNEMEEQDVTVKIWADTIKMHEEVIYPIATANNVSRFTDEIMFLRNLSATCHPNLVKLMGCCCEDKKLGVVYDLKSLDTVRNLIAEGTLKWQDRIKVAFEFASLLEFLHGQQPQYLVRNISAAHIMLDQDFNPVLFEFGMLTGGIIGDKQQFRFPHGAFGYIDPLIAITGVWTDRTDVFAFGVLLLELLCKCAVDRVKGFRNNGYFFLYNRAQAHYEAENSRSGYKKSNCSLVHKSFAAEPTFDAHDGPKLTKLAIQCVEQSEPRPTMREVVEQLKTLHVVRNHGEMVGECKMFERSPGRCS